MQSDSPVEISTNSGRVTFGADRDAWRCHTQSGASIRVALPIFTIGGSEVSPNGTTLLRSGDATPVFGTVVEHRFTTSTWRSIDDTGETAGVAFMLVMRTSTDTPFVRFRFELGSVAGRSAATNAPALSGSPRYLAVPTESLNRFCEVTLSEFDELLHTHRPIERPVDRVEIDHGESRMGPIMTARVCDDANTVAGSLLLAYEHGSQTPDRFLEFRFSRDTCAIDAVRANFPDGLSLDRPAAFESVWFVVGVVDAEREALSSAFREFERTHVSANAATRKPFIFYNTWNYQERHQAWERGKYLDTMKADRILAEIDVAHRMGVDVFVIDTGWYGRTGDWTVNTDFFPEGLGPITRTLDGYGMKLGLWFSPRQAAVSSRIAQEHLDCRSSRNGTVVDPTPVWETEESYSMCLVSRYWEAFADELIRCNRDYGVTYYKWDAIGQYGCDDPNHHHGTSAQSPQERSDLQAFEQVRYMQKVIDRLCAAVPDAIVDFDITEHGRSVGLAFLASGKYFLINNGPYYRSFDDPEYAPGGGMGSNVFVFPGPARARLCRSPLTYDRWIPSVLFLTHFLPDDPTESQLVNLASLMLGQNGIWGDLLSVSEEGVSFFGRTLSRYKRVRDAITRSRAVITGSFG
ncbi:MAG: hypothetical protein EA382_11645, partial [Spirochaetaceae bacterium]